MFESFKCFLKGHELKIQLYITHGAEESYLVEAVCTRCGLSTGLMTLKPQKLDIDRLPPPLKKGMQVI